MTTVSVVIISKNERGLDDTLHALAPQCVDVGAEIVVVDASNGALDDIAEKHPAVRWIRFTARRHKRITIPEQRNAGVRAATGEVIVFIDCGCIPDAGWLRALAGPILAGDEEIVAGPTRSRLRASVYDAHVERRATRRYVDECPTGNLAFSRRAFDAVRGFDESFDYASDIDISWRWRSAGLRILSSPDAVVRVDWGTAPRQVKRSFLWGAGRARLYMKHRNRLRELPGRDPIVLAYPLFLLGLPMMLLAVYSPVALLYPALVLLPLWRNRRHQPLQTVVGHFAYGMGVLWQLGRRGNRWS